MSGVLTTPQLLTTSRLRPFPPHTVLLVSYVDLLCVCVMLLLLYSFMYIKLFGFKLQKVNKYLYLNNIRYVEMRLFCLLYFKSNCATSEYTATEN